MANMIDPRDRALSILLKSPKHCLRLRKYHRIFKNERRIVLFYIQKLVKYNALLDRSLLRDFIRTNVKYWLTPNKQTPDELTELYIQDRVNTTLLNPHDYEEALIALVLKKYDEILEIEVNEDLLPEIEETLQYLNEQEVSQTLISGLISLQKEDLVFNDTTFQRGSVLKYTKAVVDSYNSDMSESAEGTYQNLLDQSYIDNILLKEDIFEWNLGHMHFPTVGAGYMVSVIGLSKVGKTRFVLGEMVYPTLCRGKNVLILSGEMQMTDVNSFLLAKRLYLKYGMRVGLNTCNIVIGLSKYLTHNEITFQELYKRIKEGDKEALKLANPLSKYLKIGRDAREVILSTYNELLDEKTSFGVPYLRSKMSNVFEVEGWEERIRNLCDELEISLLVIDHMGLLETSKYQSRTEQTTSVYQLAKKIAQSSKTPMAVVAINHIDTDSEESINKGSKDGILTARAFNTNEAKKSADIEVVLYTTEDTRREGQICMAIPTSRWEEAIKESVVLDADYLTSNFTLAGDTKEVYSTHEEIDMSLEGLEWTEQL